MSRVLVVEDERLTREFVVSLLHHEGYAVEVATDGLEAIRKLSEARYDAVLLDLHLPHVDGVGIMEFLAEHDLAQLHRVIVVTGLDVRDLRRLFPICAALAKPVVPSRLLEQIRRCLA